VLLADGSLFAGDLAMNFLKPCGLKYRPIYAENYEEIKQSWGKLRERGARMVYPSHGSPFSSEYLTRMKLQYL
jgi:glyoxylase-like metal-dependent hydrolase (beta-lactamase superfamily II)